MTGGLALAVAMAAVPLGAQQPGAQQAQQPGALGPGDPITAGRAAMAAKARAAIEVAQAKPTPRATDGKVDLSGLWTAPVGMGWTSSKEGGNIVFNFPDYGPGGRRPMPPDGPKYKPDLVAKVEYNDVNQPKTDKVFQCGRAGVPRIGAPQQIIQTPREVLLMYVDVAGETFRVVPTDGRTFRDEIDASYNGDSIGRWEGDTLVIESRNFTDETWFGERGYFHSDKMTVVERLTRKGDTLSWNATVTDPEVLTEPWTTPTRMQVLTTTLLEEPPPCTDIVADHLVNTDNHGQR
jgi:hypothetical protein